MLNFVICDDDLNTLNKLSYMFESIFMEHNLEAEVVFKTSKDNELLSYINNNPINVLVLDIKLHSNMNGLEIANLVRKHSKNCYIIFTTGHPEYVFQAYQYKTFDYLCKPITKERLEETVLRLFEDINESPANKQYIRLNSKNTIIDAKEIDYIKRDGMKLIFHTNSRDYEVYSSFAKVQEQLPNNFIRCHKSFIANVNKIKKLEPSSNTIYFDNNHQCDIGPKYKSDFMKGVQIYGDLE